MRKVMKEEEGAVLVIFALTLFVLLFFAGLATDFSMLYMRRSELQDLCNLVKTEQFTRQDEIRFANNPGLVMADNVNDLMKANGFYGDVDLYFMEEEVEYTDHHEPVDNQRAYRMRVVLHEDFPYNFMRLFKQTTAHLTAYQDVEATFGDGGNDVIWKPGEKDKYNGLYRIRNGNVIIPPLKVLPSDW